MFQADLQSEVMLRLERLEERLVIQMQESQGQFHSAIPTPPSSESKSKSTDSVMDTLDGIMSRLKEAKPPGTQSGKENQGEKAKTVKRRSSGRLLNRLAQKQLNSKGLCPNRLNRRIFSLRIFSQVSVLGLL